MLEEYDPNWYKLHGAEYQAAFELRSKQDQEFLTMFYMEKLKVPPTTSLYDRAAAICRGTGWVMPEAGLLPLEDRVLATFMPDRGGVVQEVLPSTPALQPTKDTVMTAAPSGSQEEQHEDTATYATPGEFIVLDEKKLKEASTRMARSVHIEGFVTDTHVKLVLDTGVLVRKLRKQDEPLQNLLKLCRMFCMLHEYCPENEAGSTVWGLYILALQRVMWKQLGVLSGTPPTQLLPLEQVRCDNAFVRMLGEMFPDEAAQLRKDIDEELAQYE